LLTTTQIVSTAAIGDCVNSMRWNHEGTPDGLPTNTGWATKGRINFTGTAPSDINVIIFWGTIY
jgi:hypothetical protein